MTGHQPGPDSVEIYGGTLLFECVNAILIKVSGRDNLRIRKSCIVKHLPCLFRKREHITAVKSHTSQSLALSFHLKTYLNGMNHSTEDGVIRIDQKNRCLGKNLCIPPE